jgi:hypothetical protein
VCLVLPVRASGDKKQFIRTFHLLKKDRLKKYVSNGRFLALTKE